jgi:hypothetical protein
VARFSPDGKRLAFYIGNGQGGDIWVKDLDRDTPSRLSFLPGTNRWPVWTPDGKNIVFQSTNPAGPGCSGLQDFPVCPRANQVAEKVESCNWHAEPPAPPQKIKQLLSGGTGAFACRTTFSQADESAFSRNR